MATKGMAMFRSNGEDFTINDPNIADEFDTERDYFSGDECNYQGDLYIFTADHPAGAWNSAHVLKVKTGEEIKKLKESAFSFDKNFNSMKEEDLFAQIIRIPGSKITSSTGEISADSNFDRSDYTLVMGGDSLTFSYELINIAFYDESKQYISGSVNVETITIPQNAYYFIFTMHHINGTPRVIIHNAKPFWYRNSIIITDGFSKDMNGNLIKNVFVYNDSCYVSTATGKLISYTDNYFATDYIPVVAGKTYRANKGRNCAWYNSSKDFISGVSGTDIQTGITAPTGAAYIRFSINKTDDKIKNQIGLYFTDTESYKDPENKSWLNGKKINWIGDSIVDGQDFDEEVCAALGLIKNYEYGINGSTIALKGDGTDSRNALCERYSNMTNDADVVAVSCGTNDFEYAWCPIGTINDADDGSSNTTFYGALKALCKGLITKYPQKVIFFTTPIKRAQPFENGNGGEYTPDDVMLTPFSKNKYGKTLMDYADIIKEVCGYYSIPVLDMYRESLLNPHISAQQNLFDSVYTHPNTTGQKIMARRVSGWLNQLGHIIEGLN